MLCRSASRGRSLASLDESRCRTSWYVTVRWALLGAALGLLMALVARRTTFGIGFTAALVVGAIGGVIGGQLAQVIGLESASALGALLPAIVGAILLVTAFRLLMR